MSSVLVVTEKTLAQTEITNIGIVAGPDEHGQRPEIRVLVPTELPRHLWLEFLDGLALLDFAQAAEAFSAEKGPQTQAAEAQQILEGSLAALREAGFEASGRVSTGDPVAAMAEEVREGAQQALIITDPHPVEDTLNITWTNTAEKSLGVPVLHLYWGTEHIDD